jgi:hypothetical protein
MRTDSSLGVDNPSAPINRSVGTAIVMGRSQQVTNYRLAAGAVGSILLRARGFSMTSYVPAYVWSLRIRIYISLVLVARASP